MSTRTYIAGMDILGAETNRAILIRVKDPAAVIRSQGSMASAAQSIAPATLEATLYSKIADEVEGALLEKGVPADVSVVEPRGWVPADGKHVASDLGYAIGGAGVLALLWYLFGGARK